MRGINAVVYVPLNITMPCITAVAYVPLNITSMVIYVFQLFFWRFGDLVAGGPLPNSRSNLHGVALGTRTSTWRFLATLR